MEIRAKIIYTEENIRKTIRFNTVKKYSIFSHMFAILLWVFVVSTAIINIFQGAPGSDLVVFIALALVIPAYYIIQFSAPGRSLNTKEARNLIGTETSFIFTEESVHLSQRGKDVNADIRFEYSEFEKVYETKDAFFLFLGRELLYEVFKDGIEFGKESALQELLKSKFPSRKYKRR